ncbi:hypothetical protein [Xylocopilactobacillus apis]|uniref:Uncharacterized protein n=1 Tax=Xylocopilactobacillus apis TaxID=2932183 RepID=A0AAU9D0I2_9LACO|nr:hypothetical protein [Xylocopilactobacillus apis]BDR57058.1 hypothetical protein KIMC2_16200 [Xylocopilactobacillus apis]
MKRKIIRYPVQASIALTWILLGIAWIMRHQGLPAILFLGAGALMLVDAVTDVFKKLNNLSDN